MSHLTHGCSRLFQQGGHVGTNRGQSGLIKTQSGDKRPALELCPGPYQQLKVKTTGHFIKTKTCKLQ